MDESRFDNLARALAALRTRRHAIASLGGVAALTALGREHVRAKPVRKSCKKSQTRCGGRKCITLKKDPRHCGACNNACPSGARCVNGQCARSGNPPQCVENDNNCGGCGKACSRDTYCRIGQCVPRYEHDLTIPKPSEDGDGAEAVFVDATGDIFAAGGSANCVYRFAPSGALKRTFGVCSTSPGNRMDQFDDPRGVVAYGLNIIISDTWNNRIQIFGPDDTAAWMTLRDGSGSGTNQVNRPDEMTLDKDGNIYLADSGNHRVTKFNASWARMMQFGTGVSGTSTLQLNGPLGVAVDRSGRVHVADTLNHRIMVFAPDGSFVRTFGSLGTAPGRLESPDSVAVASNGDIFVADNFRVQQFDSVGNLIRVFSLPPNAGIAYGVAVDGADNLYVATESNGILRYSLKAAKPSA